MMLKLFKKTFVVLLVLVTTQNLSTACSCFPYEPVFCRIVDDTHHIVRGIVTGFDDLHLMKFQIIENINKEILEDTVIVYGQDGLTCGESLDQFNENDTLILAVNNWEFNGTTYWYLEGFCGLHFLKYEDGLVKGQITDNMTEQPIQDFKDNLFTCLDMEVPTDDIQKLANDISIYPNPIMDNFQITASNNLIQSYEIFSTSGQRIVSKIFSQPVENLEIQSNHFGEGILYIRINTSKGILTKKLLKL